MRERRVVPRYVSRLTAQVRDLSSGSEWKSNAVTLSTKGACLDRAAALNAGQRCQLAIEWHGREFKAEAEVMWKTKDGQAGLKFMRMDSESEGLLREICTDLPLQPLTRLPEEPDSTLPPRR